MRAAPLYPQIAMFSSNKQRVQLENRHWYGYDVSDDSQTAKLKTDKQGIDNDNIWHRKNHKGTWPATEATRIQPVRIIAFAVWNFRDDLAVTKCAARKNVGRSLDAYEACRNGSCGPACKGSAESGGHA